MQSERFLCREFTSIERGSDYADVKPTYQIGLLKNCLY